MPLTMRPTGLGAGIDKDRPDYTVYCGGWAIGAFTRPVRKGCLEGWKRSLGPHVSLRAFYGLSQGFLAAHQGSLSADRYRIRLRPPASPFCGHATPPPHL